MGKESFAGEDGEELRGADVGAGSPCGEGGEDEDAGGGEEAGAFDGGRDAVVQVDRGMLVTHDEGAAGTEAGEGTCGGGGVGFVAMHEEMRGEA